MPVSLLVVHKHRVFNLKMQDKGGKVHSAWLAVLCAQCFFMREVSLEAYKCREMCENGVNVKKRMPVRLLQKLQ